ncbi:TetR/AcrR family transcriptional regulator [Nocardioides sp. SLBN-35]|uniref:TetR/AcrR family transcriptional regulator n=1 Tax=Nocardioides sp. SLBN-35 TaxID=2768445 RepID=UPI001150DD93|nr:TetR/AcrR family transcriptional regulator [Nocardioides sp. SLBN-35]TQK72438.1 TetR family transcriptional regulator [Nocardioides sp. SLBN-35]
MVNGEADDTRSRILREAAVLFASRGYERVSTRDIATACGIKQPSLYWYFDSKRTIMAELIGMDLRRVGEVIAWLSKAEVSPAARLFRFLHIDVASLSDDSYNLVGIYDTNVLEHEDFAHLDKSVQKIYRFYRAVLRAGVREGQFVDLPLPVLREFLIGIDMHAGRLARTVNLPRSANLPRDFATLALRGVLADPGTIEEVSADALALEMPPKVADVLGRSATPG